MKLKEIVSKIKWKFVIVVLCVITVLRIIAFIQEMTKDEDNEIVFNPDFDDLSWIDVTIDNRKAIYTKTDMLYNEIKTSLGEVYKSNGDMKWFYKAGTDSVNHLILQREEKYLYMWKFHYFEVPEDETYSYDEVLKKVFCVDGAEDIVSITTRPISLPTYVLDHILEKEIQGKVGTHTYTNKEDIVAFYNILSQVRCYGNEGADSSTYLDETRFTYSFSTKKKDKEQSGECTYGTRELVIMLANGEVIDCWKYDALSGVFYEIKGFLFTEPLKEDDVKILNQMFGIV